MVWEDAPKLESYLDRKDIVDSKELVVLVFALDSGATHRQACLRTDRQIHLVGKIGFDRFVQMGT